MNIKDSSGNLVPVETIKSGHILATEDFDDYGLKKGEKYKVHFSDASKACIFPDGEVRLANGEIRADVMETLIWINDEN